MAREKAKPAPITAQRLREVLGSFRYNFTGELELQDGIAQVLFQRGIRFDREVRLSDEDRPDFIVDGGIAIEVKVEGSPAEVNRQLQRYTKSPRVSAVLLVTRRAQHAAGVPAKLGGKPVSVLVVGGGL